MTASHAPARGVARACELSATGGQAAWVAIAPATDQRASMWVRPDASVTATQVQTGLPVIVCLLM